MEKIWEVLFECKCPECGKKVDAKISYDDDLMNEEFINGCHYEESLEVFINNIKLHKWQDKEGMRQQGE